MNDLSPKVLLQHCMTQIDRSADLSDHLCFGIMILGRVKVIHPLKYVKKSRRLLAAELCRLH